jgi:polyhydroxyalkanoate depolymerase
LLLYSAYHVQTGLMEPVRRFARAATAFAPVLGAHTAAGLALLARMGLTHERPSFDIHDVPINDTPVPVVEEAVDATPFATLLHFRKETALAQPKVLLVAPLSGHFSTLLRGTVRTMLPDFDVYLTDWHNARDISLEDGHFGFDEHVAHMVRFIEHLGPGAHVLAVCQPCVQVLAAVALMSADNHTALPLSMTLMAGPIDPRINPTSVNQFATSLPLAWFRDNMITTVPCHFEGSGRKVYPGFLQVTAFLSMNGKRHLRAHADLYRHLVAGEQTKAARLTAFYDEYFAVSDMAAEFYLETVDRVFQQALLARGELVVAGRRVDPGAIRKTALLTVEGSDDDICAVGQTAAAHDLCSKLRPAAKHHYRQEGVGHYGVFSGTRWERQIYPRVRKMILSNA